MQAQRLLYVIFVAKPVIFVECAPIIIFYAIINEVSFLRIFLYGCRFSLQFSLRTV